MEEDLIYQFNISLKLVNKEIELLTTKVKELENEVYFLNKKVKKLEAERDDGK